MNKINLSLCILVMFCSCLQLKAEKRKILFIGNSYTAVNDLPNTLKGLALSLGDTLEVDSNTPGGMTFNAHSTDATTLAKIALGGWDYVVLQAQSQEPSFDPVQVATDTYPYAKKLDSLVHVSNPCAETIFYMTWGRKNGDASNCAAYPPICTYAGMQQRLRESYLEMSLNNNATCSPAGVAWKNVRDTYPLIELYNPDESHPSLNGTYLIACTFYATIYHKSCIGAMYAPGGVTTIDGFNLQTVASQTVLDSIENWQQHGSLPRAKYSFTNNQNQYSFTNQSLRSTQYEWNFGDASAINTQTNPTHTYTAIGNYAVTLKAKNSCGKYDLFTDSVHVSSIPSGIQDVYNVDDLSVIYSNGILSLTNNTNADKINIFNLNGSLVKVFELANALNKIPLHTANGIYFYTVWSQNKIIGNGKFEVN